MNTRDEQGQTTQGGKTVSRREFLKIAGVAGVAVGMGAGLGGLLAACGEEAETPTTAGATTTAGGAATTAAGATTTTGAASTTTVAAGAEAGRALKIGIVEPQTGALASHGIGVKYALDRYPRVVPDGIISADGKKRQIELINQDTQSDSNRSAQVTADLIQLEKVDILVSGGAPDTFVPSAEVCESMGCPSLSNAGPWQAFWYQRKPPAEGFKWTYGSFIGSEQTVACFIEMYNQVPNNKVVGMLVKNDAEGTSWIGEKSASEVFAAAGFTLVTPDPYPIGSDDFTKQISEFKKAGCEIICGTNNPPDFTNFWKQAVQQGLRPKLVSTGNALLFPQTLDAIGPDGIGLIGEVGWHRTYPFKDYLDGTTTCDQLADDFEKVMDMQVASGSFGAYLLLQWATDVLKRATNPEDKESVAEAIRTTNIMTASGPVDFTSPVDPNPVDPSSFHPVINCRKQPFCGGQWVKGTGKWDFENVICSVLTAPDVPVGGTVQPMTYSS